MSYTAESTTYAPCPPAPSVPGWSSEMRYAGRRHGVGFGIILIMLGCIFLAAQFVPRLAWWTLWPVIFVVGGLVQAITADYHGYYSVHARARLVESIGSSPDRPA